MVQLTPDSKCKILAFSEMKLSGSNISKKLGIPVSTVNRILARHKKTGTVTRKKGSGRPKKIKQDIKKLLLDEIAVNPKISLRKLSKKIESINQEKISICTIKRALNSENIGAFSPLKKPLLRPIHIKKRFEISRNLIKMPEVKAKTIIFSDESKFNLFYSDGQQHVWRKPKTGLENKHIQKTIKGGGGSVMVWACFSHEGIGRIHIIEGVMNGAMYVDILSRNLFESANEMGLKTFIFQQDNDPKHTSKLAKEFFSENEITVLDWPAQSPDLNPIEHLWALIKIKVAERMPKNLNELKRFIVEEWNSIPKETCQKYALSFKNRATAIHNAMGSHTHY